MQELLKTVILYVGSALSGLGISTIFTLVIKKYIKHKINKLIEETLEPKAKEVMPNQQLKRIEKTVVETKNEILEMRGKKK